MSNGEKIMKLQVFETSVLKPFSSAYEAAKKQLEQYYEMNMFANEAINDNDLKKGVFQEGSIFFNYDQDGIRKAVRIIPYMNQKVGMHAFKHPIIIDTKDMSTTVIFNANPYGQLGLDGVVRLRQSSMPQFNFMVGYACILAKAAAGLIDKNKVLSFGNIVANTYSVCMAQALAKSFSLDYSVQLNIQAICAFYYYYTGLSIDEDQAMQLSSIATKLPLDQVKLICDNAQVKEMQSIADLASAIAMYAGSERLEGLKPIVIYTMLKQYWVGENGAEVVCAAYEMPHLWAFLCFNAMEHVLYRKNQLSEILKLSSKHFDAQQLSHAMRQVLSNEA